MATLSQAERDEFVEQAPTLKLGDRAGGFMIWCCLLVIAYLPSLAYRGLAELAVFLRPLFGRRNWRQLQRNITEVLGLPQHSYFGRAFARQVVRLQILMVLETLRGIIRPGSLAVEGFDELRSAMRRLEASGLGQLVVTAHLGSWELIGYWASRAAEKPFIALAKPNRRSMVTGALHHLRLRMGTKLLWTGQKTLGRQMLAALHAGSWLGFVMDQKPRGRQGMDVTFFGRITPFVSGPAGMAAKAGRPVLAIFCVRLGPCRYRLLAKVLAEPGHSYGDAQALTQVMASEIERVIGMYPEQWAWDYKRWQ